MRRDPGRTALMVPGCLIMAGLFFSFALASFDQHLMWPQPALNLSEAAANRDLGEIVRLIQASEDPDAPREVRLADTTVLATPLEAAVASKDVESVRVLLTNGATMTGAVWHHLRCVTDSEEMREFLDRRRPPESVATCHSGHPSPGEASQP
jgi:hypothetical protein